MQTKFTEIEISGVYWILYEGSTEIMCTLHVHMKLCVVTGYTLGQLLSEFTNVPIDFCIELCTLLLKFVL